MDDVNVDTLRQLTVGTPLRARLVPFVVFAGLTLFQGRLGPTSPYWVYLAKTLLGMGLLWLMWPVVTEMRWSWSWEAVAVGVGVFVVWVGADPFYPRLEAVAGWIKPLADQLGLGSLCSVEAKAPWNPHAVYGDGSAAGWTFALVRLLGSTVVVPPLEEVFYRSFLYRYVAQKEFLSMPLREVRWMPFLITSVVFGLAHHEWLAGILCGLAYQALACRRGQLGEAMTAHAITNLLLGLWVIGRGQWQFW